MIDEIRLDKSDDESITAKIKIEVLDIDLQKQMVTLRIKVLDEETEKVIHDSDFHLLKGDTITISGDTSELEDSEE